MSREGGTRSDLSRLVVGCARVGSLGNPVPLAETRRMFARTLELGVGAFDTADIYGQGDSEREIGRILQHSRRSAFVVTKIGQRFSARMRVLRPLKPLLKPLLGFSRTGRSRVLARRAENVAADFTPANLRGALADSLRRLRHRPVDALLLHGPTAATIADEDVVSVLMTAQSAGDVARIGVSCEDYAALEATVEIPAYTTVQISLEHYLQAQRAGLLDRLTERGMRIFVREVIRQQPGLSPPAAVARALTLCPQADIVVGMSTVRHLESVVEAVTSAHR